MSGSRCLREGGVERRKFAGIFSVQHAVGNSGSLFLRGGDFAILFLSAFCKFFNVLPSGFP